MAYSGEQKREYQRNWIAERRTAWFETKNCVKCGATEYLEIHHIDPNTKVSNSVWSWSKERRDRELAKCEVLCHACHLIETVKQQRKLLVHGTRNGYRKPHGCRCEACVNAATAYREAQRISGGRKHQPSYKPK